MKKIFFNVSAYMLAALMALLLKLPVQASDAEAYAPIFNSTFYAKANADLVPVLGTDETVLLNHFLTSGMSEGRQGSIEFNVDIYQKNYPDLVALFGDDLASYYLHYMNGGKAEGRIGNRILTPTVTEKGVEPLAIYNPINSLATSPLAPRPAESLALYENYFTWTASNGYVLKTKYDTLGEAPSIDNIIYDQPLNFRPDPNNAFYRAYIDAMDPMYVGILFLQNNYFLSSTGLPMVSLPKTKQTDTINTSNWETFAKKFNILWMPSLLNPFDYADYINPKSSIVLPNLRNDRTIYISTNDMGYANLFEFKLDYIKNNPGNPSVSNCWRLEIKYNIQLPPSELLWYAIRNSIRLVSPDAEMIYPQIYEHFYGGNHIFPEFDLWVPVGNSQVMVQTLGFNYSDQFATPDAKYAVTYYFR